MTDIAYTLSKGWPGSRWRMNGDDYENIEWLDEKTPKPTLEEIEAKYEQVKNAPPERIEKRQLIVTLIERHDMADPEAEIEATLNAIADAKERRVALAHWKHATQIPRRHNLALLLQAEWEWEDGKMDQLWIDASDA